MSRLDRPDDRERSPEAVGADNVDCDLGDDGAHVCSYCGRPFVDEELLALHRGHVHPKKATDDEQAAFEAAYEREREAIRLFRLKALGTLVLLYFGFLMVYAFV